MNALNFVGFLFFPAAVLNLFELINYFWVQDYRPQFVVFSIPLFGATAFWYIYNIQKVDWFKYKFYKVSFFDRNYYVIALPFLMPWIFLAFDLIYVIPVFILALLINDYCLRKYFLKKISMIPVAKAAMGIEDFDEENIDIKGYYKNFFIRTGACRQSPRRRRGS